MVGKYPRAFTVAVILHLGVIVALVMFSLFRPQEPEEPFVFEVYSPPMAFRDETPPPPRDEVLPDPVTPSPPVRDLNFQLPDIPQEAVQIPRSQERQRPAPTPTPTPPPPPPVEQPRERPPERIRFEDHARTNPAPRPTPRPAPAPPRVETPRVNAPQPVWQNVERNVEPTPTTTNRPPTQAERDELARYFDRLHAAIHAIWAAQSSDFEPGLVTRVRFSLTAEGVLQNPTVVTSSGNRRFDQSILAALRQVRPIGPVPTRESMTITLPFRMVE